MRIKRVGQLAAVIFLFFTVALAGCTMHVPMHTTVPDLQVSNKIPLRAALLISEELRAFMFRGNPESFTGGGNEFVFPLGGQLEKAAQDAFSQIFRQVTVVRARPHAKDVEILVEPGIVDFHFRFDQLSYAGFAMAAVAKIRVKVTLTDGRVAVWARDVESPEERSGPWAITFDVGWHQGNAASKALAFALKEIAAEASKAPELWVLADKVRTERGGL